MARWPLLLVTLLLAGCSSPEPETAADPVPSEGPGGRGAAASDPYARPAGAYQEVFEFTGQMTGAGYVTPVQNGFVGIITMPQGFTVESRASKLTVTMTWDVPGVYYLDVEAPGGQVFMDHQLPQSKVVGAITFSTEDVMEGRWEVMARSQGAAAVNYVITATVDYDAT